MFQTTCFDVWRKEEASTSIITLCKALDHLLGGGIPMREITELCGGPGTGKTQFCLQLSINVQFPKNVDGVGGKALYVDTNQGFAPERFKEIADCMQQRYHATYGKVHPQINIKHPFTLDSLLNNVSYIYCANHAQLLATVGCLKARIQQDPLIKLIIIDSFSFPLRHIEDVSTRTRIVYEILTDLQKVAMEFDVAIVITNEMTTRVCGNNWLVCPALGDSHTHKINQRIILSRNYESGARVALLDKSVVSPKESVNFQIKESGVRGVS